MKKHVIYWLGLGLVLLTTGCQKEKSFELGNTPAKGSLQSDATGDCLPKTVTGSFVAGTVLVPATNTIVISVNVTQTGAYTIATDTVNGYFFRTTGRFTTAGINTVTLQSSGTPFAAGPNNFVVSFDGTVCDIQVDVLPVGTTPAVFTLVSGGTPVNCATADTNGVYIKDAPVNATTNNVDITVNVTAIGTYTIRATGGGLTFQKTATFTTTGNQIVRLPASGTPTTAGSNTITFDAPFASCSFVVTVSNPVTGTLGGAGSACAPITVNGTYTQGVPLPAGNTVQVQITTSVVGPYSVSTNTVAGISFSASGTSTGAAQTITLINNGASPTASGPQTFTVTFGTSTCTFVINVLPSASGSLGGGPGACAPITVNGTYTQGVPLPAGNTVQVQITTSAVGPYSITTDTRAGISFSASGTSNGATQLITLINNGATPTASGPQTFTVTFGTSTCTFSITIAPAAGGSAFTPNCATAVPNGLYETGLQLNCSNTVDIEVNVTALGAYNITTTATNGMTFSKSGTFTVTGVQTITLAGSGTPVAVQTSNIPMPGTTPCTFPIIVTAPFAPIDWQFTVTNAPATTYKGQTDGAQLIPSPPGVGFLLDGSNSDGSDALTIGLADANGTIVNGETYSSSATPPANNSAGFEYILAGPAGCTNTYKADPTQAGVTMTFTVTSHNVPTKTITGTFSGTAKNIGGQTITITTGTFRGTYQ